MTESNLDFFNKSHLSFVSQDQEISDWRNEAENNLWHGGFKEKGIKIKNYFSKFFWPVMSSLNLATPIAYLCHIYYSWAETQ